MIVYVSKMAAVSSRLRDQCKNLRDLVPQLSERPLPYGIVARLARLANQSARDVLIEAPDRHVRARFKTNSAYRLLFIVIPGTQIVPIGILLISFVLSNTDLTSPLAKGGLLSACSD